jgi:anti-sigma factor RsiW
MEPQFNRAEDMLRRVSPEGRALAHRERMERQRRTNRQLGLCALLALALWLLLFSLGQAGVVLGGALLAGAVLVFLLGCAAILLGFRKRPVRIAELQAVPLTAVPAKVGDWLGQQRNLLPPPAAPVLDSLSRQLSVLGPQLAAIEHDPGANAVRKLVATELPELVERYRNIPASVAPADAGAQLVEGLKIIDGEIHRISSDLASGSFDALATQNRYLQLKYDVGLGGS